MNLLWADTETVGTMGEIMRIQYAVNDGPIKFLDYPFEDVYENNKFLGLLKSPETLFVAYFSVFDLFHLYRWVHKFVKRMSTEKNNTPAEPFACRVLDLQIPAMLYGPFKHFAFSKGKAKSVARVRRIPRIALEIVRDRVLAKLRPHVPQEFSIQVGVHEVKGQPELCTLSFNVDGRTTLKAHARFYGAETLSLPDFWPLPPREIEKPWLRDFDPVVYAPFIQQCQEVMQNAGSPFHTYCRLDIWFLRLLADRLCKSTGRKIEELVDHHSDCVHVVAYLRYFGFPMNRALMEQTRDFYKSKFEQAQRELNGIDLKSSKQRLELLRSVDPLVGASNRKVLEMLAKSDRPSAKIAEAMIDFGKYRQRWLQCCKLLEAPADRAYPSLRVMGTRTGRTAGSDGFNWQGIAQPENGFGIRNAIGAEGVGDWSQFEVILAGNVYPDPMILSDVENGIDAHCMNLHLMHPKAIKENWSYEFIKTQIHEKNPEMVKLRKGMKPVTFGIQYFCQAPKVAETLGISLTEAQRALDRYYARFVGFAAYRKRIEQETLTADTEHWSKDSVSRMARSVTDLTGFTMTWDFEAQVAECLWSLGGESRMTGMVGQVLRTKEKGYQTIDGSIKSALLGGALAIQQAVSRQRGNAGVQAAGANLTKMLQARIWNELRLSSLLVHDELVFPTFGVHGFDRVKRVVDEFVEEWTPKVKLLNFDFHKTEKWGDK